MSRIDAFTQHRLLRFIEAFRKREGQLPTLSDLEREGFPKHLVNRAVREELLSELYVTLTNGTVMKGYKPFSGK